jgi:hypothetical protein
MPFTEAQFFDVFALYNLALWPWQIAFILAGVVAVLLLFRPSRRSALAILAILSGMWLVNGVGYHWVFFASINPVARMFAAAFVLQALLLAGAALLAPELRMKVRMETPSLFGLALVGYALLAYPVIGWLAGHRYPAVPVFGVAPCPTVIFTVGMLLQGRWRDVRWLLVIPGLWAVVGGSASVLLGVPQDYGLIAALIGLAVIAQWQWRGRPVSRR